MFFANSLALSTWMPGGILAAGKSFRFSVTIAPGSRNDGRSDHMLVIRIGKPEGTFQRFPAFDLRVGELSPHRGDEGCCAAGSLRYGYPPLHELDFLVELEFVEDRRAPDRSIRAPDRERKEEVALRARPQHAGVEGRREHDPILSVCEVRVGPFASLRRPRLPRRSEVSERLLDVVFVDGVARGGEHVVLTLPPALSVLEQIREENASVRSPPSRMGSHPRRGVDNGRAAHVQEIRCLLGGEPCCLGYN